MRMTASASLHAQDRCSLEFRSCRQAIYRPFVASQRPHRRSLAVECRAEHDATRREAMQLAGASLASIVVAETAARPAQAAKSSSGYNPIKDQQDGYSFLSPFGWQEVAVKGQDVVYKDVIEPLESVSVSLTPTDKSNIEDYGSPVEIAATLSKNVLTPQNQDVKVLNAGERIADGRKYVEFEFASKAPTYIRHALASVTIANGKFYTLTTGANEFRWDKMKDRLKTVVESFEVVDRF